MSNCNLQQAAEVVRRNHSFLVLGHINPDGDCIGCMSALGLALGRLGKSVAVYCPDGVPDVYKFLPRAKDMLRVLPADRKFDAALVVDCEHLGRLGPAEDALRQCGLALELDHHPGGVDEPAMRFVALSAASCGEVIFNLLQELGIKIEADVAECLLTAIITDTGSFRFSSVTPSTLRIAAELVEAGASTGRITNKVYETRSLSSTKLLGLALSTLETTPDGRIAYAYITRDHMASSQADDAESEGIVNYVRGVRGAQVGMLLRETPDGMTRVSLRSSDGMDISQVARLFGGGGHRVAAGCTVDRPLPEAIDLVMSAVRKWMGY